MKKDKKKIILESVLVTDYAAEGKALAKLDGKVIFISGAVPGDVADVFITKNKKDHNSIFKGPRNNNFFKHKEGEIVIKTIKEEMDKSSHDHYNASAEKQEETSQLEEVIEKKPVEEETVTLKKKDYEALLKLNEDLFEVEV